jgi:hypothetical protein
MDAVLNAIQKTPVSTILILAGLLFLLLGVVTKIGGIIEVSPEQKRWTLPLGLLILAIGLAFYFTSKPADALPTSVNAAPVPAASVRPPDQLSFRSWQGTWNLQFEYNGQWTAKTMTIQSDPSGIQGDYELGRLRGVYDKGDASTVTGQIENTTGTGSTCDSGKQTGSFSLTLTTNGRSMAGWWDVCGAGRKWMWKADKRD